MKLEWATLLGLGVGDHIRQGRGAELQVLWCGHGQVQRRLHQVLAGKHLHQESHLLQLHAVLEKRHDLFRFGTHFFHNMFTVVLTSFFLVYMSSTSLSDSLEICLRKRSWKRCLITSKMVVPPLLFFCNGVMMLSMSPELPSSMSPSSVRDTTLVRWDCLGRWSTPDRKKKRGENERSYWFFFVLFLLVGTSICFFCMHSPSPSGSSPFLLFFNFPRNSSLSVLSDIMAASLSELQIIVVHVCMRNLSTATTYCKKCDFSPTHPCMLCGLQWNLLVLSAVLVGGQTLWTSPSFTLNTKCQSTSSGSSPS